LLIPEGAEFNLKNLAVAIDFSEHSADAMDSALAFAKAGKIPKINMIHVYQLPTGYHKTGKSCADFSKIMRGHAQKHFAEFKTRFDTDAILIKEEYYQNDNPVKAIKKAVEENSFTFLSVGARGRGAGAAVLLGSVSERLIENLDIPVLAVKKKGTGLSILNAIFK
jgi:nucleotide-binding universal stress UspA family protein